MDPGQQAPGAVLLVGVGRGEAPADREAFLLERREPAHDQRASQPGRLGQSCAYYVIEPKFGNQTQFTPDSFNHTSSILPSLGDITFFAADNESVQLPIDVSFQYKIDANNPRQLDMQSITLNGATINDETTIAWNVDKNGFYGNLFFELWIYNSTANALQYNERYVSLWLKMNP